MNKMIALDLDGTILKNDKSFSKDTIATLKSCENMGNIIVFTTARPPRDILKYIPKELRNSPIICYNGACIIESNNIIYKKELSKIEVSKIINIAQKHNQEKICIEINNKLYSNFDVYEYFGNVLCNIVDLVKLEFSSAFKIIICNKNKVPYNFINVLPKFCKGIITDNGILCQIMKSKTSKWNAIRYLLDKMKVMPSEVIAFGDDYNDIDMIKNAGIGIAMNNAESEVKAIANYVTDFSNNDDGVSKFLQKYAVLYTK